MGNITREELSEELLHNIDSAGNISADTIEFSDTDFIAKTVKAAIKENKTNATNALNKANEAFQSASNGKQKIATAITGKGIQASGTETFDSLSGKIDSIEQFKGPINAKKNMFADISEDYADIPFANNRYSGYCDCGDGIIIGITKPDNASITYIYEYNVNTNDITYKTSIEQFMNYDYQCIHLNNKVYFFINDDFYCYNRSTNRVTVKNKPSISLERGCKLIDYKGKIYSVGGKSPSSGLTAFFKYDDINDIWDESLAQMPMTKNSTSIVCIHNDELYVLCGGYYSSSKNRNYETIVYNFASNTWTTKTDMLTRTGIAFSHNNMIYIINSDMGSSTSDVHFLKIYDPTTSNLTINKDCQNQLAPVLSSSPIIYDNKVYYFGKSNSKIPLPVHVSNVGYFDLQLNDFYIKSSSCPYKFVNPGMCVTGDNVYIVGCSEDTVSTLLHGNMKNNTWTAPIISGTISGYARTNTFVDSYKNKIYFGGGNSSASDLYCYNPATKQTTRLASSPNSFYGNAIIHNDKIYVPYAYSSSSGSAINVYTFSNNTWTTISPGVIPACLYVYNNIVHMLSVDGVYKINSNNTITNLGIHSNTKSSIGYKYVYVINNEYYAVTTTSYVYKYLPETYTFINKAIKPMDDTEFKHVGSGSDDKCIYFTGGRYGSSGMKIFIP